MATQTTNVKSGAPITGTTFAAQTDHHGERPGNVEGTGGCCSDTSGGNFTLLPILLTTVAVALSLYAHHSCRFLERRVIISTTEGEGSGATFDAFSLGLWSFMDPNYYGFCYRYPSNIDFDPYFKTSQAMGPLSSILGGIVMINFWFASCVGLTKSCWRFCGFILLLALVCEGLTFLIFKSDFCKVEEGTNVQFECFLSTGGRLGISACVLYFVSVLVVCKSPHPSGIPAEHIATVRTETIRPDGTRIVETRQIVDGV